MKCYFQGCKEVGVTKEHIPPRSFFPKDERDQLLTVKSCIEHNNQKSKDDLYALAQICMNAAPSNRAREVFEKNIAPQLEYNDEAFKKMIVNGAKRLRSGPVQYRVDTERLNDFFTALSCGIVFKASGESLPSDYTVAHVYCSLTDNRSPLITEYERKLEEYYSGKPDRFMEFGKLNIENERIYSVESFGLANFQSSITLVHLFFGKFKVISMLTKPHCVIE